MGQQNTGHGQEVYTNQKKGRGQSLQAEFYISCQLTVNRAPSDPCSALLGYRLTQSDCGLSKRNNKKKLNQNKNKNPSNYPKISFLLLL